MEIFFIYIYNFFKKRRVVFFFLVAISAVGAAYLASRITFEEDINKMVSAGVGDEVAGIMKQSKFLDKVIVNVSHLDTNKLSPSELISTAEILVDTLKSESFKPYIKSITFRVSENVMDEVFNIVYSNLPVFLDENDYKTIDSLTTPEKIESSVNGAYSTLLSPASFAMKKMIVRDPLGLSNVALKKLGSFQSDDSYILIDGCVFSKDKHHLLIFLTLENSSNNTAKNTDFVKNLDKVVKTIGAGNNTNIEYFGSAVVAVGNAERLKKDIRITLTITIILLALIINFSIKKKSLFPFIFLPTIFGGLVALAVVFLLQAKISIISLSICTVILAITVDYTLHITTHFKHKHSIINTIKDVSFPIIVCGFATAFEFLALVFVSSESLHELGILAAISIVTAAFFTMIVIPHILDVTKRKNDETEEKNYLEKVLDKVTNYNFHRNRFLLGLMAVFTVFASFFIGKAGFESDMMKMNYMPDEIARAEENLNKINNLKMNSIYIASTGNDLQTALLNNEKLTKELISLKNENKIASFNSPGTLLFTDSTQIAKIKYWNNYWTKSKKEQVLNDFNKYALLKGFKPASFKDFHLLLNKDFQKLDSGQFKTIENNFFSDNITSNPQLSTVMSLVKVDNENKNFVTKKLNEVNGAIVIDRKSVISNIVDVLGRDFNFIANISLLLILLILIIAFGRLEIGFITFVPILFSWIWTLGIMGMTGIKFNIFNIIISSFITGLGIDYSIYIMQGLVQGYKTDNRNLLSYKTCILISVLISISGTGVLILAKHPSLKSIALVSIIGLLAVVLISYTFELVFFNWLINKKGKKRILPVTASDLFFSAIPLLTIIICCIVLHMILLLLLILPVKKSIKKKILHYCVNLSLKVSGKAMFTVKIKVNNETNGNFKKPSVIIANHQSHLDLPVILMQSPKIIVLTTTWVWNNPIYALIIRYIDFYPVTDGYEALIEKLRKKVEEGYSILVFPEGSRSEDSTIKRFHKGAFLLAEKLNLDILPVIIHGAGDCMNKGENHLKGGIITLTYYPRIKSEDLRFGKDYHQRTKAALSFFREEYAMQKAKLETPAYFRRKLIRNYIYKGPVLEWYTRVKTSLEKNYEIINRYIPRKAEITDIGCGYGMMSYMLSFLSDQRIITGIDYDADKIELASHCISRNERINFIAADAATCALNKSDVFILSDVLHYLPFEQQDRLLSRCIENLNENGVILVRDANKDLKKRHWGSRYTEFFSTRSGFNKAEGNKLYFFSGNNIKEMALKYNMKIEVIDDTKLTSNLLYVLQKN